MLMVFYARVKFGSNFLFIYFQPYAVILWRIQKQIRYHDILPLSLADHRMRANRGGGFDAVMGASFYRSSPLRSNGEGNHAQLGGGV
jgi:hypothetical protein